jgi:hypothetical protein
MVALMLLASCSMAFSDDLAGQASIIDGDTLEIHGTRIRLWGITSATATVNPAAMGTNSPPVLRENFSTMAMARMRSPPTMLRRPVATTWPPSGLRHRS